LPRMRDELLGRVDSRHLHALQAQPVRPVAGAASDVQDQPLGEPARPGADQAAIVLRGRVDAAQSLDVLRGPLAIRLLHTVHTRIIAAAAAGGGTPPADVPPPAPPSPASASVVLLPVVVGHG